MIQLNLNKSAETLKLNLTKLGVTQFNSEVHINMDVSGSFDDEHRDGSTTKLFERLMPYGLVLDNDKQIDFFTFSDGQNHVTNLGKIDQSNYIGLIKNRVIDKVIGYNRGTDFHYVMNENLIKSEWIYPPSHREEKQGFFSKLFSGEKPKTRLKQEKTVVFIVTDGENSDPNATQNLLSTVDNNKDKVFFMFIRVSNEGRGRKSPLLESYSKYGCCDRVYVDDLKSFINLSDEELNKQLLTSKLINFFKG